MDSTPKRGEFRWRRVASNGEIVGASSEGYTARKDCDANANRDTAGDKWEFYKDKRGQHRWRALSMANKMQVGKSTEAFASPSACKNNARMNGRKRLNGGGAKPPLISRPSPQGLRQSGGLCISQTLNLNFSSAVIPTMLSPESGARCRGIAQCGASGAPEFPSARNDVPPGD